jgi:predicted tellurium resistance membrane protein TerC
MLADLVMSMDNVVAIAGASKGNLALLIFGLACRFRWCSPAPS